MTATADSRHRSVPKALSRVARCTYSARMSAEGDAKRPAWLSPALLLVYSALWAVLCDMILELSIWHSSGAPWYDSLLVAHRFAVGSLYVWVLIWMLLALTRRTALVFGLTLCMSVLVAVANAMKIRYLAEPLVSSDLHFLAEPEFLMDMVPGRWLILGLAAFVAVLAALVVGSRHLHAPSPFPTPTSSSKQRRFAHMGRVVVVVVTCAVLLQAHGFSQGFNPWRRAFEFQGSTWAYWDPYENYLRNGFIGGFMYSLPVDPMPQPEDYSRTRMSEIASTLSASQRRLQSAASERPNVVVVLCESCSDPLKIPGVRLPEDPLPNYRRLAAEAWSGEMVDWVFGHGTSVMEYQVLTGHSMALFEPQVGTPMSAIVAPRNDVPSVVSWFGNAGYETTAIHPFRGSMYGRQEAYPELGFDTFIDQSGMTDTERFGPWISDQSAMQQALRQIEGSATPQFVHVVTMQNHIPSASTMPDPIHPISSGAAGDRDIGGFASGMRETDRALGEFLTKLESLDEPTTILFFGDHAPPLEGLEPAAAPDTALLRTPFMIWSSHKQLEPQNLGSVSPSLLMPLVFEQAGLTEPPYFELLRRQMTELGTIERTQVTSPSEVATPLAQLDAKQRALLEELRLVQYDLTVGSRYSERSLWDY